MIDNTQIIDKLKELTDDYVAEIKDVLSKNDCVFAIEKSNGSYGTPFCGVMPKINDDMVEDLFFELVEHPDCVMHSMYEKSYVESKIAAYKDYNSPRSRILRHIDEIKRLKKKYNVDDEDLAFIDLDELDDNDDETASINKSDADSNLKTEPAVIYSSNAGDNDTIVQMADAVLDLKSKTMTQEEVDNHIDFIMTNIDILIGNAKIDICKNDDDVEYFSKISMNIACGNLMNDIRKVFISLLNSNRMQKEIYVGFAEKYHGKSSQQMLNDYNQYKEQLSNELSAVAGFEKVGLVNLFKAKDELCAAMRQNVMKRRSKETK